MINVNQITSMLSRMALPDLQKYAAMHKNDPYIVSLAMSVANQKKQAEVAKNGIAGMQPQPKVVDQEIAQMVAPQMPPQQQMPPQMAQQQLPENIGIGQLPAQNMQGMADGGIVGYADTGLVQGFKDIYNMTPEEIREAAAKRLRGMSATDTFKNASAVVPEAGAKTYLQGLRSLAGKAVGPLAVMGQSLFGTSDEELKTLREADARRAMQGMPQSTISGTGDTTEIDNLAAQMQAEKAKPADGKLKPPAAKPPRPGATTDTNVANPATSTGGIDALQRENDAIARLKSNMVGGTETEVNKTDFLKELGDISKPTYDKATAMIEKEKGRLKEGKEQDFYMALIEGGLAAAGETGPDGLQNLAKGFSKGAASYRDALKDFRKGSQENAKMELELTRAEAAEKKGDIKTYYERMDKYQDRKLRRDDSINQGIAQITNTGLQGQNQRDVTQMNIGSQEKIAKLNREAQASVAGMPNYIERMVNQMPGSTYADKLKAYSEIMGPNARADSTMLIKYMGMTPAQKALFKRDNPQAAAGFDAQLQVSGLKPVNVSDALP
jgi:hypothetical protein